MDETLKALQRENRILRKKLARTEHNLQRLEEHKIRAGRLHRRLLGEARESADRLRVSEQAAQKASQAKSTFLATMSHELRTPLNAIIAYSDLLLEEPCLTHEETIQEDLREIQRAGNHLLGLIESILNFSRIEAGHIELHEEMATLSGLLHDAGQLIEPLAIDAGSPLLIETDHPDEEIWVDRLRLRQVLLNLLSNAVKFSNGGAITLSAAIEDGLAFFRVEDSGPGIPEPTLSRIFEAFYQESTRSQRGGVGLGLSVSSQLCERMGGRILVESTVGEGSRFTVVLPRQLAEQVD